MRQFFLSYPVILIIAQHNPQFWSFLQAQKYVLVQDNTLPATIKKEFSDLELNNNSYNKGVLSFSVALPVKVGNEFYGALLLCEKSGEYIPVHEEIEQISNVANQIAVSFYNAMLLNQAVLQAEREKKLRRISELVISNEHKVRSRERFQLSEALHNDVLQELIAMGKNSRDNEVKNSLNQVINKIRLLNFELSPRNLEGDFIGELKRLVQHYQRKSSTIRIEDPLVEGDLLLLESVISIKHKEALYNAVKEIINNALKHSAASQIKLNIDFFPVTLQTDEVLEENDELLNLYNLHLEVEDDGIGLNPSRLQDIEQLVEEHHFGLNNLKWSIEKELGGKVLFYSELNRGMQVVIDFVLNTAQNQGNSELERLLQELDKDMFLKGQ